jgi:2-keto-3-deoxy-L-rhamnonate aldolase RhmA
MPDMRKSAEENPVKRALREGQVTIGTWIQIGHPAVAEIFANSGFDWIAADCEHTDIDIEVFAGIARGMYGRGSVPLVRVRENDTLAIRQVLDAGAQGIIVPLVNSAAEAQAAVLAAKYPPLGVRGFAFCRANNWGSDFDRYARSANDQVVVVVMIESREAVEHIDEILAVDGVDGVFIGPYDMSGSYGLTGQTSHPTIQDACARVVAACRAHQKAAGIHLVIPTDESVRQAIGQGFTFIALGVDTMFLAMAGGKILETARKAARQGGE